MGQGKVKEQVMEPCAEGKQVAAAVAAEDEEGEEVEEHEKKAEAVAA